MYRGADSRLYEKVWTRDGYKPVEVGREYPHQCVSCDAVISHGNRSTHSINGIPQKCEKCHRYAEIRKVTQRIRKRIDEHLASQEAGNRRVHRDIACRYIAQFGGQTYSVQTDVDDCTVYLKNAHGKTIARVSMFDRYPKLPKTADFHEMPF